MRRRITSGPALDDQRRFRRFAFLPVYAEASPGVMVLVWLEFYEVLQRYEVLQYFGRADDREKRGWVTWTRYAL